MTEQNPFISKSLGKADQGSRGKAAKAMEQSEKNRETIDSENWPRGLDGHPMAKITMTAAELIPTGQYANVSVGPVQITAFVDTHRDMGDGDSYFADNERVTLAMALNELAEIVEGDVVAVQRNLVMESLAEQISS